MTERLRKAGMLQTLTIIVFLAAACLGVIYLILENYGMAAILGGLMAINFMLYQQQSSVVRDELSHPSADQR